MLVGFMPLMRPFLTVTLYFFLFGDGLLISSLSLLSSRLFSAVSRLWKAYAQQQQNRQDYKAATASGATANNNQNNLWAHL